MSTSHLRLGNSRQENQELQTSLGFIKSFDISLKCMRPYVYSGNNSRLVLLVYVIIVITSAFLIIVLCRL